jgi:hypothetical protein
MREKLNIPSSPNGQVKCGSAALTAAVPHSGSAALEVRQCRTCQNSKNAKVLSWLFWLRKEDVLEKE